MQFSALIPKLAASREFSSLAIWDHDPQLIGIAAVQEATSGQISYIDSLKFASQLKTTQASALILPKKLTDLQAQASALRLPWVAVDYPRLAFAQAIDAFYTPYRPQPQIHPTAVIDPTVQLGEAVAIGAHVVIEAGCILGDGVVIHPNVVIYPECRIGDRTVLHANCTIEERSQIGADCVIHAGAVIGGEGFGFVPTPSGWYKMQQSGCVVLEDLVEVGCNSAIDRPAVGETRIGRDTKLDNMVHIGHGSTVGQGCAMAAQGALAGGVTLGNRVILAGQVGVGNNAHMGDGSTASSKAGVHHDVPAGQIVSGYPAVDHQIYLKSSAIYSRLPEMYKAYRQIKSQAGAAP
jgi:UDP-3-O-[3-hydroxymyristoyl] glucosamine N-acyltransferase